MIKKALILYSDQNDFVNTWNIVIDWGVREIKKQ